jgi:hypothetical protein
MAAGKLILAAKAQNMKRAELMANASAPEQSAPINILTFEERREFWTSLRQALLPIPEAYEAVNKLLAARVEANRIERNGEHRDPGTLSKNGSAG